MTTLPRFGAALIGLASTLSLGCGSDSASKATTSQSTGADSGADSGADGAVEALDPNAIKIELPKYQLAPAEEREYVCYTVTMPADRETTVTGVRPITGKAVHHLGVYQTMAPEPDGLFDCPELFKLTWVSMYGAGVSSGPLTTPAGSGFKLPGGTQILVQLHLLNTGEDPVEDKVTVVLETDDSPDLLKAGVYGLDDRTINIPANMKNVEQTMDCAAKNDMDVFAVWGHMHRHGTTYEISRGANVGDDILYKGAWDFNEQAIHPVSVHINAGDTFHIRCTYDNTSDAVLSWGEKTANEMCTTLIYYTPYTGPDGCLKTPTP